MENFSAKKSLGQHWLKDEDTLDAIIAYADIDSSDTVLEIGPGEGALTRKLLKKDINVWAVEFDKDAYNFIYKEFEKYIKDQKLNLIHNDIRKLDLRQLPKNYKIVANIPYYLTSYLIHMISESQNRPQSVVLLVQKEVAERICARPGDMSILSITSQFYWETNLGVIVLPKAFAPPPKVKSQVVILNRRDKPIIDVDNKKFFRLVKAGFSSKRKTLSNSLSANLRLKKSEVIDILTSAGISPTHRAQQLNFEEWNSLYNVIEDKL